MEFWPEAHPYSKRKEVFQKQIRAGISHKKGFTKS